jgi:penicillin-binding protein-related factor A (putative recombinase)
MTSVLEDAFKRGYDKYLKAYFSYIAHIDHPTRKKKKLFPDVILNNKEINYCIELKHTSGERMRFRRLKDHQLQYLLKYEEISGLSYVLFSLNDFEKVFLMKIKDYLKFKKSIGQKSFTLKHISKEYLEKNGLDTSIYQEIPAIKPQKHHYLDLRLLIPNQTILTNF